MKILSVMDPLERLQLAQDTTIGFMNSAARRGAEIHICTPEMLYTEGAQTWAHVQKVTIPRDDHVDTHEEIDVALCDYDCVWMRKDPPVDQGYLHTTYLLDFANTWVINPPAQLRAYNEKLYALRFIDITPETRVSARPDQVMRWLQESDEPLIVKPLDGYGGLGVCLLDRDDRNSRVTLELLTQQGQNRVVVQRYLPEARRGDHRVLIINGEVVGSILRTPQEDDHRGNIHVGGRVTHMPLNTEERALCDQVARQLHRDGIFFAGLDLIGGKLTEINITSPTGIRELKTLTGVDAGELLIDAIERRLLERRT